MKKILDIFKNKKKKTDYEIVKSRSGLPIHILPLPDEIKFDIEIPNRYFSLSILKK